MEISQAQHDVRTAYLGGFAGQLVTGLIWLASAAAATWLSHKLAAEILIIAATFIFPLTRLLLRLLGHPVKLTPSHPFNGLAMQTAFIIPLSFPVIFFATTLHHAWFYPALMIIVGAHYLPFIFLYGMPQFGVLAALLIAAGTCLGFRMPNAFTPGGWITAILLLAFAFIGRRAASERN